MENERFIHLLTLKAVKELTDAEWDELNAILSKNPELRYRKEMVDKFWDRKRVSSRDNMAMFKKLMATIEAEENKGGGSGKQRALWAVRIKQIIRSWQAAAAILVLAIGMLAYFHWPASLFNDQSSTAKWFQTTTNPAVRTIIKLADGTLVTLNSATTLKYPDSFAGNTREVYLDGEAYFDVHKDHQHPFIIHANKMHVKVLGTAFNVKSYHHEPLSETTLIRGSVEVTLSDRPSDRIILKPQEKLIVQNNMAVQEQSAAVTNSPQDNTGKGTNYSLTRLTYFPNSDGTIVETSWVQNKLVFADKDFVELSVQLERWYGLPFVFANDKVKTERFSGIFEKETLSEALDALKIVTPFKYKINKSRVYIY